jgi:predicted hotdog family 3-hydroxylacyl-ACP dehydratase
MVQAHAVGLAVAQVHLDQTVPVQQARKAAWLILTTLELVAQAMLAWVGLLAQLA